MKPRPIIFNTEMVRAILYGRKTQTRRPMQPQPHKEWQPLSAKAEWFTPTVIDKKGFYQPAKNDVFGVSNEDQGFVSPFGAIGDQLWVRETFCIGKYEAEDKSPEYGGEELYISQCFGDNDVIYKQHAVDIGCNLLEATWKPSIHMPRSPARIILEVTDVRVERLNDISEQDAINEGCDYPEIPGMGWKFKAAFNFKFLWKKIYGEQSLKSNPWVWVIEFKVISTTGGEA